VTEVLEPCLAGEPLPQELIHIIVAALDSRSLTRIAQVNAAWRVQATNIARLLLHTRQPLSTQLGNGHNWFQSLGHWEDGSVDVALWHALGWVVAPGYDFPVGVRHREYALGADGAALSMPQLVEDVLLQRLPALNAEQPDRPFDLVGMMGRGAREQFIVGNNIYHKVGAHSLFRSRLPPFLGFTAYRRAAPPRLLQELQEADFMEPCSGCGAIAEEATDICTVCDGSGSVPTAPPAGWMQ